MIQEQLPAQRPSHYLAIIVLLIILVFAVLYALAQFGASVGTQTSKQGQCLNNGQSFNAQQEAFTLAQEVEQYRTANPYRGNYGLGSYTFCYKDGTQNRSQSPIYPGYNNTKDATKPINATHSEQKTYKWLEGELNALPANQSPATAIYVVIFSQVIVCGPCRQDMKLWQRGLRSAAKTSRVFLSIWDIVYGKGFNPATYQAGMGTPVTIDAIRRVPIVFAP